MQNDDRIFFDLIAYAPGMNTHWADIEAVLEVEALPSIHARAGQIDASARALIDKAREEGWRTWVYSLAYPALALGALGGVNHFRFNLSAAPASR